MVDFVGVIFVFNETATTEIYTYLHTLSRHDALPILCDYLNRDPKSPFNRLIRRVSDAEPGTAVVTDSAIVDAIKRNLKPPMGALSQYKQNGAESDPDPMYRALVLYWTAVRDTFPDAWGKPPSQSRLLRSEAHMPALT